MENKNRILILPVFIIIIVVISGISFSSVFSYGKYYSENPKQNSTSKVIEKQQNSTLNTSETKNSPANDILNNKNLIIKGSYAYFGRGAKPKDPNFTVYLNPEVVGMQADFMWKDIETSEGVYNFSSLDDIINLSVSNGKKVKLIISTSGIAVPDWVKNLPSVKIVKFIDTNHYRSSFCKEYSMPVFWDAIYMQKKEDFIKALGQKYSKNPNIVSVMVSFASAYTGDWEVPHNVGDIKDCGVSVDYIKEWLDAGYTTEKMFNAGKQTMDAWAEAFPKQAAILSIGATNQKLDGTAMNLAKMVSDYGYLKYPKRFYIQSSGLSLKTPFADDLAIKNANENQYWYIYKLLSLHSPQIGLEMAAAASNGKIDNCRQNNNVSPCPPFDVLMQSVRIGLSYRPTFINFWQADAQNKDLEEVLKYANSKIGKF